LCGVHRRPAGQHRRARRASRRPLRAGSGGNCEDDVNGNLYFQSTRCIAEDGAWVLDYECRQRLSADADGLHAVAEKRKFVSDIYYVRDYAVTAGDGIPTLMRSEFALAAACSGTSRRGDGRRHRGLPRRARHRQPQQAVRRQPTGSPVNYAAAVNWYDPLTRTTLTNRGDGSPDGAS
jgi:type IV pilus assembly protein PilW